jgi:hypothetical protein
MSDASLRPCINIEDYENAIEDNPCTALIAKLGMIHRDYPDLVWGDYRELCLTNEQYSFARGDMIIAVNNADHDAGVHVSAAHASYTGLLGGIRLESQGGWLDIPLRADSGEILVPTEMVKKSASGSREEIKPVSGRKKAKEATAKESRHQVRNTGEKAEKNGNQSNKSGIKTDRSEQQRKEKDAKVGKSETQENRIPAEIISQSAQSAGQSAGPSGVPYAQMSVGQLQEIILGKMAKNGPITDQMRQDVMNNIWHDSLIKWAESFR